MTGKESGNWLDLIYQHRKLLSRLAHRRFPSSLVAEEALSYVMEKLEEDNGKRVSKFKGKSELSTYLASVTIHLLEDFSRKRFGRARPREWLKPLGDLHLQVFMLLCIERWSIAEATEILSSSAPGGRDPMIVEEAICVVLSRITDCGSHRGESLAMEMEELEQQSPAHPGLHQLTPEELTIALESAVILEELKACFDAAEKGDDPPCLAGAGMAGRVFALHLEELFEHEERLFLRAVYVDGLRISQAGRLLGWTATRAHNKHDQLMTRLLSTIRDAGLEQDLKSIIFG